jgi:pyridoxamine 5'-phosphate oxidase
MDKKEVLSFISANPIFALATSENDTPHVRYMMVYRADAGGIVFHTGESKDLYRQLSRNPQVEMCFYNQKDMVQIRVSGTADFVEDIDLKKQIVKDRPFLQRWVDDKGYDSLCVYRITGGKACAWTMATNFAGKEYIQL